VMSAEHCVPGVRERIRDAVFPARAEVMRTVALLTGWRVYYAVCRRLMYARRHR
jgi:hypothetical protein